MPSVKFQSGLTYTFGSLKFYAMNGCICIHDEDDGSFIVTTRREFLLRAQALSDEVKRASQMMTASRVLSIDEERKRLQDQVEKMVQCCYEAQMQGDHDDPEVAAWFRKHRPWAGSRRRQNVSTAANFHTDKLKPLSLGRYKPGRECGPGVSAAAAQFVPRLPRPRPKTGLILPDDIL